MKPSIHTIVLAIALLAAAIAAAMLADAWLSARHDTAQLAATLASQKRHDRASPLTAKKSATRQSPDRTSGDRGAKEANWSRRRNRPRNAIPSVLPPLPLPISISIPEQQPSSKSAADLPATVTIPQTDLKPLYDDLQDCRATTLETASLTKDLADEKSQAAALTTERDAAVAATHGGTFLVRLKREAKWLAIGVAIGAVTAEAAQHR